MSGFVKDTILYNGQDLYDVAFLRVLGTHTLTPPLRRRQVEVPGRSGVYDYGAEYHDMRRVSAECIIERQITLAQFDTLKYILGRQGNRIIFHGIENRYFTGRCYDAAQVLDYAKDTFGNPRKRTFNLEFECQPYGSSITPTIVRASEGVAKIDYEGSWWSPTRITITNTGGTPLHGINITARNPI